MQLFCEDTEIQNQNLGLNASLTQKNIKDLKVLHTYRSFILAQQNLTVVSCQKLLPAISSAGKRNQEVVLPWRKRNMEIRLVLFSFL